MESIRKINILSWLLFLLVSPSRIMAYSFLNWPKVYIPHWGGPFFWMSLVIIPFSKIFLTVPFVTLTQHVSFLFLFLIKHLFKCVALLWIYIIVVVFLFIDMWDFNSFMYVFSYEWHLVLLSRTLTVKNPFWNCKVTILVRQFIQLIKSLGGTNNLSFNKVFNSLSLCFVFFVMFYKPF